jgi:SAM-dependent methyltransferase
MVSLSKTSFYKTVLDYLDNEVAQKERSILDIGCGYGYFLELALKRGWRSFGIEVVGDAVKSSQDKIGEKKIFGGKLKEFNLDNDAFDAISLWDVIAIVDNPYEELKECFRLLNNGGIIGIRTRNASFQKWVYRVFGLIKGIALRYGFKEPYVFNKYCFGRKSLYVLLSRLGYTDIKITNSPLTSGDPYNHMPFNFALKFAKICLNICSKIVYFITRGRCLMAPSLLIWAQKP